MNTAESKWCQICLSHNEDDKITNEPCYSEFLNQLTSIKYGTEIQLCMWCKSILKKTIMFKEMALASEKALQSQHEVVNLHENCDYKHIRRLSYTNITHLNVPADSTYNNNVIIILNESANVTDNPTTEIFTENVEYIENEGQVNVNELNINEVLIEDNYHSTDFLNEEIYDYHNENITPQSKNINNKQTVKPVMKETNVEFIVQTTREQNQHENKIQNAHMKQIKKVKENERSRLNMTKRSRIDLKLEELQFEVRYLNLEEQLKEMERKKIKYKDRKFQCDFCGVGFLTNDYFEDHKIRHTKVAGQHKCTICSLHFKTPLVLSQHMLSHKRILWCTICGAQFSKWSNCVVHRQKCGAVVMYTKCRTCNKVFSDEYSLKVHTRVHSLLKQYSCEQCGMKFNTKQRLAVHLRSHTGVKPFSCSLCPRSFTTNSNLKAHSTVHSDQSEHYCVECNTYYKTAKSLKRHLSESVRHIRERSHRFKCKQCSKEYSTLKSLQHHVVRHSDGSQEIKCPQCSKTFSSKSNLRKHMKCIHKNDLMTASEK